MSDPTDEHLVRRSAEGDRTAFVELVRRYEQPLATLIRYQLDSLDDAEDILQETLLAAWSGLRLLREPDKVRAWLMQVARNRCRDFLKSSQRRELATDREELEQHLNRRDQRSAWRRRMLTEIVEAIQAVPCVERDIARLFYLEGLTIAEIAARHRCPPGTVKRRLFGARSYMRQALGIASGERVTKMRARKPGSKSQPFPRRRPEIVITPVDTKPFGVDCPELRFWWIVPEVGKRALAASYDVLDGRLTGVIELRAVRPAEIEGIEGVEIEHDDWSPDKGWQPSDWRMFGRLTDQKAQWLGEIGGTDKVSLRTFLDSGYAWAWPEMDRRIEDTGRFLEQPDGSFKQAHSPEDFTASGAGVFNVRIGDREFTCLRVFLLEAALDDPDFAMTENYVTEAGRTVFRREYCHRCDDMPQDESKPLTIDGVTLFQFGGESLSGIAVGIEDR